jgi:hypothetical protein
MSTRISGPSGPQILALAEGWLASLTRGLSTLNLIWGRCPLKLLPVAKKLKFITDMYTKELFLVFITEDFKVIKMAVDKEM